MHTNVAEKCEDDDAPSTKFSWEGVIVGVLKKADDKELSIKKLRKKVRTNVNFITEKTFIDKAMYNTCS